MGLTLQKLEQLQPNGLSFLWLPLLLFLSIGLGRAYALSSGQVSITNTSGPRFILDSNSPCTGPRASYVVYQICNTSSTTLNGVAVSLGGLSSGFSLAGGQTASQTIGTMAPGTCTELFWFVSYPCTFNTQTNLTVTVSDSNPGTVSKTDPVFTRGSLSATAGGLLITITVGPGLILGSTTYFDVEYEMGNIPKNGHAFFQPAGNSDFNAACMKLKGSEIMSSTIPLAVPVGAKNKLYFIAPESVGGGANRVKVRYTYEVACNTVLTVLKPFASGNSGNQLKHTSNYGSVFVDVPTNFPAPDPCLIGGPDEFATRQTGIGLEDTGDNWSSAWGDYNNDGYPDLYVTTHDEKQPNALFRNNGNGTFTKVNSAPFSTDVTSSLSSTWGDYDNDGDLDLYVANNIGAINYLYRNEGGGVFTKVMNDPIVSYLGYSHGVSWADYDNDGFLDLFVAVYWETAFNLLYHNNGDGTFTEVTNNAITNEAARSVSGAWADYDSDGFVDLFVANTGGQNNSLYHNLGNGEFERITTGAIVNDGGSSVGASWGDYNNDSYPDLFVPNAGNEASFLYKNNGDGSFTKITSGAIVTDTGDAHGSAWADWDNDGDLDLFVARDGSNNSLYRNDGNDVFTSIQNDITDDGGLSFGSSWADYDRDGDLDLFVANRKGQGNFFYKNTKGTCKNWASIKLIGSNSNRSGIGAKVFVTATINGQTVTQMREVSAQSGGGTGGQNSMQLNFGLGNATTITSITIEWPSGYVQTVASQPIKQFLQFTEPDGAEICGTAFNDANGNCLKDGSEAGIPNAQIILNPGNIIAYTDDNGDYSVFVRTGNYTVQQGTSALWTSSCPSPLSVNASVLGGTYCGNNFGNTPVSNLPDLTTELFVTAHRIGENNLMLINYKNQGVASAENVVLELTLSPEISILTSSLPYAESRGANSVVTYTLGNLAPNGRGTIYVSYLLDALTPLGLDMTATAQISYAGAETNTANNFFSDIAQAVAAFDPNDISVSPTRYFKRGDWLQYKVRFQNVGNFPASQVRVEDELPEGLDLSTLELGSASHTFKFQSDGRKLVWTFPNINLPDSTSNEPGSHGYLLFRIKPSQDLAVGAKLPNHASIFFDNLQPVLTNEVENVLTTSVVAETKAPVRQLLFQPNPTDGRVSMSPIGVELEADAYLVQVQVFDQMGKLAHQRQGLNAQRCELLLYQLTAGGYVVKAVDNKGRTYSGRLVVN